MLPLGRYSQVPQPTCYWKTSKTSKSKWGGEPDLGRYNHWQNDHQVNLQPWDSRHPARNMIVNSSGNKTFFSVALFCLFLVVVPHRRHLHFLSWVLPNCTLSSFILLLQYLLAECLGHKGTDRSESLPGYVGEARLVRRLVHLLTRPEIMLAVQKMFLLWSCRQLWFGTDIL